MIFHVDAIPRFHIQLASNRADTMEPRIMTLLLLKNHIYFFARSMYDNSVPDIPYLTLQTALLFIQSI